MVRNGERDILRSYKEIIGSEKIKELRDTAKKLRGKKILHLNTSKKGGGVAEILKTLVPFYNNLDLHVDWKQVKGSEEFEETVKKLFNQLQGTEEVGENEIYSKEIETWRKTCKREAGSINPSDYDVIVIHDAGPLPIIDFFIKSLESQGIPKKDWPKFVWRDHMDTSNPNKEVFDEWIKPYIQEFDALIYSDKKFTLEEDFGEYWRRYYAPGIDPLSKKNKSISKTKINNIVAKYGVDTDKPIILQVSRFDRFKGQKHSIEVFKRLKQEGVEAQLVLIGGEAEDDPHSKDIREEVKDLAQQDEDIYLLSNLEKDEHRLPALDVNAFQRKAAVILQPSEKEGFGLTITEALWKQTPVVATNVGGIHQQIDSGEVGGYLVDVPPEPEKTEKYEPWIEKVKDYVKKLIHNPALAQQLGKQGREHVGKNFLLTRLALHHLQLMTDLID